MIRRTERLVALEARWARERLGRLDYADALALYEGLWREAVALNRDFPGDWREDIAPDLEVARVLNALPTDG
jgi:hypothetical protein